MEDEIYKAHILDHYNHPRHHGALSPYTRKMEGSNPSCGDELTLFMNEERGAISQISFTGRGCAISQAATSMLLEKISGKTCGDISSLTEKDVDELLGITVGESREKCAYLSLATLKKMCIVENHA